jgi:tetratricopeptide (TPR) repeat protein
LAKIANVCCSPEYRRHTGAWLATAQAGDAATRAAGDHRGQAACQLSLALAHRSLADFDTAIRPSRGYYGRAAHRTGDYTAALRHATAALTHSREAHDPSIEVVALTDPATIRAHLGHHRQALHDAAEALDTARRARSCHAEVEALIALAEAQRRAGQPADALDTARQALALAEEREYRLLQARTLTTIAASHPATGDDDAALVERT